MQPVRLILVLCFLLLVACAITATSQADDWPHWRGLKRNGNINESSHFKGGSWPPAKPTWSGQAGSGGSGVIVIGDRLYTMGWKDDQDHVLCMNTTNGQTISTAARLTAGRARATRGSTPAPPPAPATTPRQDISTRSAPTET